jgi:hypothetical protein
LTARRAKTVLSEKMIEDDLSWVEQSSIKSIYKLGIGFERCEDKGEKSVYKFISSSTYHKEEATIKRTKAHYPSKSKPSFNPKREVRKETPKLREEAFVCMFCGRDGHLYEFCFRHKMIERRRLDYARNSYCDGFSDFPPRALPHTFSHALSHLSHGPNHRLYDFGSRENNFELRRFVYDSRPHRGDHFPRRPIFPTGGSHIHFEPRHLDNPWFPRRGSRLTRSSGEVLKIVKTSSGRMVKCWIPKIYLTNPSTEPSTFSHPL